MKSPGPDRLLALFYQRHMSFLKSYVCRAVQYVLEGKECPEDFNDAIIVLILKVNSPELLTRFCPISLCNVLYKIALKTLVNRLKKILPIIISKEQSAFAPGRLIIDYIFIAYECVHAIGKEKEETLVCDKAGYD
jgi:hypothetical protein